MAARSESARRVSDCVTALLRDQPFFGSLALRLPIRADETRETLASDGKDIRYAPQWVADTDADRIKTALARVVLACALKHHTRRGGRDPERWQRASQLVTHGLLRDAGFALPPEAEAWDGISAEQAYDRLPEPSADAEDPGDASSSSDVDDSGSAGGPQCGNGDEDQSNPSDPTDDNSPQEQDEPGSDSNSAGSKPSGQMPASHDPCGTGEVIDADERRDDATGQSGESPLDTPAEEQAWDEAMHQAASLARAQGKGRQVAAIILDHWLRGRRRALWLSASDKLLEDARRDWAAIGGSEADIIPLGKFRQGADIPQEAGILFATYATLRSPARQGKRSRLDQIVGWLADGIDEDSRHAYGGVIVFDEAHAMANAAGAKGSRGDTSPSQQGRAGLRLQNALPDARILYVSATGATTVPGLAYARRLGLWGGADSGGETPFEQRTDFVTAMEAGGVAAMEVVARDLKALGLYQARALSYDGVEVELLEHPLTPEQRRIYDAYAGAFKVIHRNIEDALKATGIMEGDATLNKNAKSAALSAFEGAKQRFFGHLLTAMKCPSLIRSIEADLEAGHACVIQLVSTGEALLDRRIADIPVSEWDDISVDLTPREACLEYLAHAFPVQLQEPFTDDEGNLMSRPVTDAGGNPVLCQEAVAARDALIEKLAALPPVQAALDQILHRFGGEAVAEVTGRSRRVLRIADASGERLALRNRPASANLAETAAFMAGEKRILVFSMAGGTGRSYHADLGCGNTARRIHYLLEPGWRADQAIQGLGRTHRTHQASAPLFRPVTTDVKGERRFIATIARRLDSLGAITRGQRDSQTAMGGGDATLFRASDNLESPYAKVALRQFYIALWRGNIAGWSMDRFEDATGLKLIWEGSLKEDLPPMPRFLNRLLALPIAEQNELFAELETRIEANIEQAIEAGTHEQGVETIRADSLTVASRETVHIHEASSAATELVEIIRRDRLVPLAAEDALALRDGRPVVNTRSKRAAVVLPAPSRMFEDGGVEARVRLVRPAAREPMAAEELAASNWEDSGEDRWRVLWDAEIEGLPSHTESRLWLVTGLLLPIAEPRHLVDDDQQIALKRFYTSDGVGDGDPQAQPALDVLDGLLGSNDEEVGLAVCQIQGIEAGLLRVGKQFGEVQEGELIGDGHEIAATFVIANLGLTLDRDMGQPAGEGLHGCHLPCKGVPFLRRHRQFCV